MLLFFFGSSSLVTRLTHIMCGQVRNLEFEPWPLHILSLVATLTGLYDACFITKEERIGESSSIGVIGENQMPISILWASYLGSKQRHKHVMFVWGINSNSLPTQLIVLFTMQFPPLTMFVSVLIIIIFVPLEWF